MYCHLHPLLNLDYPAMHIIYNWIIGKAEVWQCYSRRTKVMIQKKHLEAPNQEVPGTMELFRIFFFAVSAAVGFAFLISEIEGVRQFLLNGGNTAWVFAVNYIGDLFRKT